MKNITKIHIGVDISKLYLDVYVYQTDRKVRLKNTSDGINELKKLFPQETVEQIVCEATGGYENSLAHMCLEAGYTVWVVEPGRIRSFAKASGIKAKNDIIDAKIIAMFSATIKRNYKSISVTSQQLQYRSVQQ